MARFTLPRDLYHGKGSLEELKNLVNTIRQVECYLGSSVKVPTFSEQFTRRSLQKCFVAAKPIRKGDIFTKENIVAFV